ncbi:MAG: hypothetical protein K2M85_09100 [Paramuribaculum sp.]|nr:hypothetical protein [Paramuribaculum sp.]
MRKKIMTAAAVAAVGISAYLGFGQKAEPTLTELQLANIRALCYEGEQFIFVEKCDDKGDGCAYSGRYYPGKEIYWQDGSVGWD